MTISPKQHRERFEQMRKRIPSRVRLEVRDVQRALGLSSTGSALMEMKAWAEMKLVEYVPPGDGERYGVFYLRTK